MTPPPSPLSPQSPPSLLSHSGLQQSASYWLGCGVLSMVLNGWVLLGLSARCEQRRALDLLLALLGGTHMLSAALPLILFSCVQLGETNQRPLQPSQYSQLRGAQRWTENHCKAFVSTFYCLTLATCFTVSSVSYHRMWMVKWPVNYRLSSPRKQAWQATLGGWTAAFILATLPSLGWHTPGQRFYQGGTCHYSPGHIGLGFGLCLPLLVGGGTATALCCSTLTLTETICRGRRHAEGGSKGRGLEGGQGDVPAIVVEDSRGQRKSSIEGSEPPKTSLQTTRLVTAIVLLYAGLAGVPLLVVSIVSVQSHSQSAFTAPCCWEAVLLWSSLLQTLPLPLLVWGCERYRPKARPMWERCLQALSQDSTEEPGRCLDDLDSVAMVSRSAETKRATLFAMERGTGKPFLPNHSTALQSRVHYLQVPANRRHSHDDSDSWSHTPSNSLLPRWSSSDDIVSNRHRLPVGSGALSLHHFLEMLPPPDAQRCIESMKEATSPCFSRQEVMRFIDQDDLFMAQRCHHSNQARRASLAVVMTTPTLTCSERAHRGRRQRPARRASLSGPDSQNLRELHCGEHRDWD
ncbi:putative G-protein coupled receptor 162 isoform X1 [Huso huso]|uniref:G-protein coupled receptor 162 isoform X1 n=1 Tax=Huso huso TaxID=61971 RepID=A0ABR0YYA7_HUSHU